jgi:hypothetical protein
VRLSVKAMGERAKVEDAEVIWRDPESRAGGELTDAMVKQQTLVPA